MSQRTKKILGLIKTKEASGPQEQKHNEGNKESYNVPLCENYDPVSNWVIEMDPIILKNNTSYKERDSSVDTLFNERINITPPGMNSIKCEISSTHFLNESTNILNVSDKVKHATDTSQGVTNGGFENGIIFNKPKKVNILSHWLLRDNEVKRLNLSPTNAKVKKPNCVDYNLDNIIRNVATEVVQTSDYQETIIIVPPKETVEHLPLPDDLPIIIENIPLGCKYDENFNTRQFFEHSAPQVTADNSDQSIEDNKFDTFCNTSNDTSEETSVNSKKCIESYPANLLTEKMEGSSPEIIFTEDNVECTGNKNYKDKKTCCFFCLREVTHFARHLTTWHEKDIDVQRMLSYPRKSKQRRNAISALAKKGNYVRNRSSVQIRPVKRAQSDASLSFNDFLPCPHCLGFYKKKSLYRHTKRCGSRTELVNVKRQSAQSDGQTALLMMYKFDELLKKDLFPHMRADQITLTAKKDKLICQYAYSYMKGRRSKGNLDLVRQNVRRLAKLLLYIQEENKEIKEVIDLLHPKFFKDIINGVNKIGKYNRETDCYESPTVAINFGTLLKKCCDLAYIHLLQEPDTESRRKELKILKTLIESQWANEISAQAGGNLNEKKWNKEELLPLTSDLKKLKKYLETLAQEMFEELCLNEKNKLAYDKLKEIIYTQIILINRRRPAEVAQLKIETYKSINLDSQENEFDICLTESEKILLNSCSRLVIRGKRGRGVPILFSTKVKEHFDLLLKVRDNFVENNNYIFHTDGKSCIDGTKILYKYAKKCGIENPKSISATRLRKHLATVTQLLEFSKSDLEQLSKFMGHTLRTHCDFYRLSDSTYQTAKISKLLLLATEGGLEKYKGMHLDQINIDLNPIAEECDLEDTICTELNNDLRNENKSPSVETANVNVNNEQLKLNKKTVAPRQSWSSKQKKIISEYFATQIKTKRAPNQLEVNEFVERYPTLFADRKWTSIKAVVYNIYTGKLFVPP